jgi:hypothetical protein
MSVTNQIDNQSAHCVLKLLTVLIFTVFTTSFHPAYYNEATIADQAVTARTTRVPVFTLQIIIQMKLQNL